MGNRPKPGVIAAAGSAVLVLVLFAAVLAMAAVTGNVVSIDHGAGLVVPMVVGAVGWIVAWKRPSNPIGWLALVIAFLLLLGDLVRLYAVLDYHHHDGRLPLGTTSVFLADTLWPYAFILVSIIILLFPDGRVPSRRWRFGFGAFLVACCLGMASFYVQEIAVIRGPFHVDPITGQTTTNASLHGAAALVSLIGSIALIVWPIFVVACLGRLVLSWRGSRGDRRQQMKWLVLGAAAAIAGGLLNFVANDQLTGTAQQLLAAGSNLLVAVLPLSLGFAVLRHRLYEIDRLISRTITYLLVSGLLVGVFAAVVLLTTRVMPFSSPVGVAASTLAAAALFTPLRRRVQDVVDRRFNRARYDAQATVAAFTNRLRSEIDPDQIGRALIAAADASVAPAYVSLWVRPSQPRADGRRSDRPRASEAAGG